MSKAMRGAGPGVWAVMNVFLCAAVACGGEAGKKAATLASGGSNPASGGARAQGGNGSSGIGLGGFSGGSAGASASGGALNGVGGNAERGGNAAGGSAERGGNAAGGNAERGGNAAGGTSANPNLPKPPPNCTAVGQDAAANLCTYNYACQGTSYYARCEQRVSGSWGCQCAANGDSHILRELVIQTPPEASPCAAMAFACATKASPGTERSCDRTGETNTSDRCRIDETCGAKIDLADGAAAFTMERLSVTCVPTAKNEYSCGCLPGLAGASDFRVGAPSLEDACGAVLGVCEAGKLPDTAPPPTCTDEPIDMVGSGQCAAYRDCSQIAQFPNGTTLEVSLFRSADCDSMPEGRTDGLAPCHCSGGDAILDFAVKTKVDNALCRTALDACVGTIPVEPTGGTPSCRMEDLHDRGGSCDAQLVCEKPTAIGALSVIANGYLNLLCQKDTANSWWCMCQANGKSNVVEVGPMNTPSEACAAAAARCPSEVEISFGTQRTPSQASPPLP